MHPSFLPYLCCPKSGGALRLESGERDSLGRVVTGTLRSPEGAAYPIVRRVPRFVSREQYASSFGYEWSRWPRVQFESENHGGPMEGHTTRMWETVTGRGAGRLDGQTLVEFGCGPGRFLDVVRARGGRVVGLDMSLAVEAAAANFSADPQVLIVQADVLAPPLRPGVFDGAYSVGVLHHTPDPACGVRHLARVTRPGGWVACSVYGYDGFYDSPAVARHRRWQQILRPAFGQGAALAYANLAAHVLAPAYTRVRRIRRLRPMLEWIRRNWLVILSLPDVRWRKLDVFDAITPEIATVHTGPQVRDWMERAGIASIVETRWGETSLWGIRAAKAPGETPASGGRHASALAAALAPC